MANAEQAVVFIILQGGTSTCLVKCHKMHSIGVYVFLIAVHFVVIHMAQKAEKGWQN